GIRYSDQYAERGLFQRLMKRLREIATGPSGFLPALATPLSGESQERVQALARACRPDRVLCAR
ncbi:MAG: hypothetical protein ABR881_22830, partial [Candidatus Sulfotelmatobacter sp.]